jgi:hypothetical protein
MRTKTQRQLINSKAQIKKDQRMDELPTPPEPPQSRFWTLMGVLAPVLVAVGCLGIVVGIVAGQSSLAVLANLMTALVGGILLLLLRWRF